jgi:hypothetical protein
MIMTMMNTPTVTRRQSHLARRRRHFRRLAPPSQSLSRRIIAMKGSKLFGAASKSSVSNGRKAEGNEATREYLPPAKISAGSLDTRSGSHYITCWRKSST